MIANRTRFALAFLIAVSAIPLPAVARCGGDCNGDGVVSINELIRGVNLALGRGALAECEAADTNGDGTVGITDLIGAVNAALSGCPSVPTATPTATATATHTATPTINQPPVVELSGVYRSFPDEEITYPLVVTDPDGGAVECAAPDLPGGASFDAEAAVLSWIPAVEQVGAYEIGLQCTDDGGAVTEASLPLRIAARSSCASATCDPQSGCETEPLTIDENCCVEPVARIPEPPAPCPAGRMVRVGRNERGFGRLEDCHAFRVLTRGQPSSSHVQFNIEARCIDIDGNVRLSTRLETATRILVDSAQFLDSLEERADGYIQQRGVFVVLASIHPSVVEGDEAQLTVRLTDAEGVVLEHSVRVILTAGTLPDLPEIP